MRTPTRRLFAAFLFVSSPFFACAAHADVRVSFYSREFGNQFPHALVIMEGVIDATGHTVSANYGFTAKSVTPAILLGSVAGTLEALDPGYIAKADRKFTVTVDDAGYARIMARIAEWKALKQPSYSLNKRNCVHFVMDLAEAAGLRVNRKTRFLKKPRSFLEEVRSLNPTLK